MALVVEDGTGLDDAESYISFDEFRAYCDNRGYDYEAFDRPVIEQRLRLASEYIDTEWRYKATRLKASQMREFPRDGLTDWSGHAVTGVPVRVKHACAELAFKGLSESLRKDLNRGGMVTSESIGPMSVSYAEGAPVGKVFTAAARLLEPYLKKARGDIAGPYFSTSEKPLFDPPLHDNDGVS